MNTFNSALFTLFVQNTLALLDTQSTVAEELRIIRKELKGAQLDAAAAIALVSHANVVSPSTFNRCRFSFFLSC